MIAEKVRELVDVAFRIKSISYDMYSLLLDLAKQETVSPMFQSRAERVAKRWDKVSRDLGKALVPFLRVEKEELEALEPSRTKRTLRDIVSRERRK